MPYELQDDNSVTWTADEPQCSNCSECESCCDCMSCVQTRRHGPPSCDERVSPEHWCDHCERCDSCCECQTGDCGCRSNHHLEQYLCSNCNRCESDCCECSSCANCGERCERTCRDCDQCDGCCDCEESNSSVIHDYGYKPRTIMFHGETETHARHYGIELEVNGDESLAEAVQSRLDDHAYLKHDGSLDEGFEIVTHPHSFKHMRKLWQEYFQKPVRGLTSYKTGQCGLHIHIERKGLTDAHLRRMVVFVNAPENLRFIERVAQRSNNSYCQIKNKKPVTALECSTRYEALNLNNRHTVELRIFRGSYRVDRVLKALDFADALVEFTRDRSYQELTVKQFTEWLSKRVNRYRYLWLFLAETHIVEAGNRSLRTEKPGDTRQRHFPTMPEPIMTEPQAEIETPDLEAF